ncbi:MAG: OB-fold nucleic acid binding domain-containing protein [Actinomycetota bacterium]|nr:OB-fold nucleic acid binding domain-containing protein [Actinomycetota bacterium]MDH5225231.1 OB-fold nucleic acid binding domain-containing protein [Actinomycetota bacterium]MDH5312488.1 OB-fold nucleic acid binding domain-containing protein [Actinomycetota bacterium]
MGAIRRWLDRLTQSDESILADETREWADSVAGCVRLGDAPLRTSVKIAGVIRRITVLPMSGHESLEALVSDGTGEAVVVFMGRRGIGGFSLGTKVVVEGVLGEQRGGGPPRMINPRLEFSA